ncbi:hypothetical protein SEUCBS139899_003433 [Sporothrix eucalyptigena]
MPACSQCQLATNNEAEAQWWYSSVGGREEVVAGPGSASGSEASTSAARYKMWLGLFAASNTLALDMSLPPPMAAVMPLAPSVQKRLAAVSSPANSLTDAFVARLELQKVLFRSYTVSKDVAIASTPSTADYFSARNPLLDVLERGLYAFEKKRSTAGVGNGETEYKRRWVSLAESDVFVEATWQKTIIPSTVCHTDYGKQFRPTFHSV